MLQELERVRESGSGSPAALRPFLKCQALLMIKLSFSAKISGGEISEILGGKNKIKIPLGPFNRLLKGGGLNRAAEHKIRLAFDGFNYEYEMAQSGGFSSD